MKIQVQEVRSRIIDVPTDNFNEAKKMAINMLRNEPLSDADSDSIQYFQSL